MSQFKRSLERRLSDPEFRAGYEDSRERRQLIAMLVKWRKDAGLNQDEVATRMGVGQSTVSQFEGSNDPRLSTVQRYARAVGAKPHFLVGAKIQPRQWVVTGATQPTRRVWQGEVVSASTPQASFNRSAFAKAA